MLRMLLHWFITALAVLITSRVIPGFYVDGAAAALIAAVAIGLVNVTGWTPVSVKLLLPPFVG